MRRFNLDRYSPPALLAWTSLFWAGNMVVRRAVAGAMSPIALAYWRWIIVIAILTPFAGARSCSSGRCWPGRGESCCCSAS
jgi:hypothetical protein